MDAYKPRVELDGNCLTVHFPANGLTVRHYIQASHSFADEMAGALAAAFHAGQLSVQEELAGTLRHLKNLLGEVRV